MKVGDLVRLKEFVLLDHGTLWLVLHVGSRLIKVQKIKTGYTASLNRGAFEVVNAPR